MASLLFIIKGSENKGLVLLTRVFRLPGKYLSGPGTRSLVLKLWVT